jgi:hypothetical protein
MLRPALLLLPALLAACAAPPSPMPPTPTRGAAADPRLDACRAEAERMVQRRERGQVMRADETETGRGFVTVAPFSRAEADRAFAQIDRDRIIADCLAAAPPAIPQAQPQAPTPPQARRPR